MFFIQLRYMRIGMRDATTAAYAAKQGAIAAADAARIARNAERPYFTPFVPELRFWEKAILEKNPFQLLEVHLDVHNIGKGVGFLDAYGIANEICRTGQQGKKALAIRNEIARMPVRGRRRTAGWGGIR
jgi:hypothetical protein